MIRFYGIEFPNYEDEKITPNTILTCHPQKTLEEIYGVPLRLTVGYQCFYDKLSRSFSGLTFYAPANVFVDRKKVAADIHQKPHPQFSYVLASFDGSLTTNNGDVILNGDNGVLIYSHFSPTKTSGIVKKGAIIGVIGKIPNGYGYGVTIRGFKDGSVWNLQEDLKNISCIE